MFLFETSKRNIAATILFLFGPFSKLMHQTSAKTWMRGYVYHHWCAYLWPLFHLTGNASPENFLVTWKTKKKLVKYLLIFNELLNFSIPEKLDWNLVINCPKSQILTLTKLGSHIQKEPGAGPVISTKFQEWLAQSWFHIFSNLTANSHTKKNNQ